jgi:hypothetical protein
MKTMTSYILIGIIGLIGSSASANSAKNRSTFRRLRCEFGALQKGKTLGRCFAYAKVCSNRDMDLTSNSIPAPIANSKVAASTSTSAVYPSNTCPTPTATVTVKPTSTPTGQPECHNRLTVACDSSGIIYQDGAERWRKDGYEFLTGALGEVSIKYAKSHDLREDDSRNTPAWLNLKGMVYDGACEISSERCED